jgi:hypothetical protein
MKNTSTICPFLLAFAAFAILSLISTPSKTSLDPQEDREEARKTSPKRSIPLLASSSPSPAKPTSIASQHSSCQDSGCLHQETAPIKREKPVTRHSQPDWNNRQYLLDMEKGLARTTDGGLEGLSLTGEFDPSRSGSLNDLEAVQRIEEMVANRMGQELDWELLRDENDSLE